jgi:hypothetical protein
MGHERLVRQFSKVQQKAAWKLVEVQVDNSNNCFSDLCETCDCWIESNKHCI